jgi:hypothetical protein
VESAEASGGNLAGRAEVTVGSQLYGPLWFQAALTCFVLVLGAVEGWFWRTDFATDAISYLDISRAIPARDWKMIFNPLWSAGYPLLMAIVSGNAERGVAFDPCGQPDHLSGGLAQLSLSAEKLQLPF